MTPDFTPTLIKQRRSRRLPIHSEKPSRSSTRRGTSPRFSRMKRFEGCTQYANRRRVRVAPAASRPGNSPGARPSAGELQHHARGRRADNHTKGYVHAPSSCGFQHHVSGADHATGILHLVPLPAPRAEDLFLRGFPAATHCKQQTQSNAAGPPAGFSQGTHNISVPERLACIREAGTSRMRPASR